MARTYARYGYEMRLCRKTYSFGLKQFSEKYGVTLSAFQGTPELLFQLYHESRENKEGSVKNYFWFLQSLKATGCDIFLFDGGYLLYQNRNEKIYDICYEKNDFSAENVPFCMVKCLNGDRLEKSDKVQYDSMLFE